MPGVLFDGNNVVVGHAHLYTKPFVVGTPATLPPDSTPVFQITTWEAAGWVTAGATNEGFKIAAEASTTTVTIEEQAVPVGEALEARSLGIEAALAEDTMQSMQWAWGGGTITSTAAASGTPGTQKMNLSNNLLYVAAVLETKNRLGFARRIFIPKMSVTGSGDTNFRLSFRRRRNLRK